MLRAFVTALVTIAVLVVAPPTLAQAITDPLPLNTDAETDSNLDTRPTLVTGGGTWIAVWVSGGNATFARSTDGGATWSTPQAWFPTLFHNEDVPRIATDGAGNWIAVYESFGTQTGSRFSFRSRSTDDGLTWSPPTSLTPGATTERNDRQPQIATDGAGTWFAVWSSDEPVVEDIGSDDDILLSVSTDNGLTWSAPEPLNGNATADYVDDRGAWIASDGAGTWVTVWNTYRDCCGFSDRDILFARSTDNGQTWTAPEHLATNAGTDTGDDMSTVVATDRAGTWVTVWQSNEPAVGSGIGTDYDLLFSRSVDNGQTWSAAAPLNTNADSDTGIDSFPTLATDGLGGWIVVWNSNEPTIHPGIGADYDIAFATSTDNGASWMVPQALNPYAPIDVSDDLYPALATNGLTDWIVAWSSNALDEGMEIDILVSSIVYCGETEICNSVDDDCDLLVDEDLLGEDTDDDQIYNLCDNCTLDANPNQEDVDSDGIGDACDPSPDMDGDGILDGFDVCPLDPFDDGDGDGLCAELDNCPNHPNADQIDTDGDQAGEPCDNCLGLANPSQADQDADGSGDACDNCLTIRNSSQSNADGDTWGDACDDCPNVWQPIQFDRDLDGYGDACDNCDFVFNADQANGDLALIEQWAVSATATSEYSATDWSASQATGAPQGVGCASAPTNWSPLGGSTAPESLELTYATPVRAIGIDVFESFESAFVQGIELRDTEGTVHTLTLPDDTTVCGDELMRRWTQTPYVVESVIVHTAVDQWEELDAVNLLGVGAPSPDFLGNVCDLCPFVSDFGYDTDGDGAGDPCDCAPDDPAIRPAGAVPGVSGEKPVSGTARFAWSSALAADTYSVTRILVSELGVDRYGACLVPTQTSTEFEDGETPPAGDGFAYLIRGSNAECGAGTWGAGRDGFERIAPDSCP